VAEPGAPSAGSKRGAGSRVARIAIALGALAIAVVLLASLWFRSAAFERTVQEIALPAASERLGRQVTAGSVEGSGFFRTSVEVGDLRIAGIGDEPFLRVGSLEVHFSPWRFLFSGGRDREVSSLVLRDPHVSLVRSRDGKWNVPAPPEKRPPPERPVHVGTIRLIDGSATVVDQARGARVEIEDIQARGSDRDPVFTLEEMTARTLGGVVRLDGTLDRSDPLSPLWRGDAFVDGIDLHQLPLTSESIDGTIVAEAHLSGAGTDLAQMRRTAEGSARIELRDAVWVHFTLGQAIVKAFGEAIEAHDLEVVPPSERARTPLGDPTADLRIREGWANLEEPVLFQTPMGRMTLDGRVGLDQRLDLDGRVVVEPAFIQDLTGGEVEVPDPVPVEFRVEGTAQDPEVTDVDLGSFGDQLPGFLERLKRKILSPFQKDE